MTGNPVNYDSVREIKALLDRHGLGMQKRFGQNFLINGEARKRLLDALEINPGDGVWEIGPGIGAMTSGLLERGAAVTAFEIDRGFSALLRELFQGTEGFTLVEGDVLKTWPLAKGAPLLLGNLPYNIAAALLADFIERGRFFTRMVVTVQRETARRMSAPPGSGDYSAFSVLCASAYAVKPLMVLKAPSFYPAPRVESQGVRLDLLPGRDGAEEPVLFRALVRRLFASRRKTLRNNLRDFVADILTGRYSLIPAAEDAETPSAGKYPARRQGIHPPRKIGYTQGMVQELASAALDAAGIDPNTRAETLGVDAFRSLAAATAVAAAGFPEKAAGGRTP
ncbi:MAG: 16S rRNA (adenine(1518)-N(6)/adenine(1519)-N(6))-dimethyltransferase RsmA [Spirochaetaceae bacterium]|nr:16S rRNA (adenine(1518)-N(6)/adenine(1519)-N(6))-dimethyltransferase RsmA [Spirochaetaceae bacterium]